MTAALVPDGATSERARTIGRGVLRWVAALTGAFVVFGVLMAIKGADPIAAYREMFVTTFRADSLGEILTKATPIVLAALAVAIPARAGLTNVGGEGQLVLGGIAAAGVVQYGGGDLPAGVALVLMAVAAALAGAVWGAFAGVLRQAFRINEAVSTLLLNYLAIDLMSFLIYDSWKDPNGSGQPATADLPVPVRLPLIGSLDVHAGFILAVIAVVVTSAVLYRTAWGFRLRVVGGNPEAARRSGFRVGLLVVGALMAGGALAGLGGFAQLAGAEFKLRPGFLVEYGYIGFLASWFARHKPVPAALAAVALAAITIAGDSLQIDAGLPAASVNILLAFVLLAVFGWTRRNRVGLRAAAA